MTVSLNGTVDLSNVIRPILSVLLAWGSVENGPNA